MDSRYSRIRRSRYWEVFTQNWATKAASVIVVLMLVIAILGPYVAPNSPTKLNLRETFSPVSLRYFFGTDEMGRCIFSRVLHGAHLTLGAALIAVFIGMGIGVPIGLVSGYFGRIVDSAFMAVADMLLAFPYFLLAVLIVAVMGPSLQSNMIAIGIWVSPYYIRLVRGATLTLRQREFVEAARMSGESDMNILFRYILPNCISVVIVWSTTYYARAILMAAALGFLGLGAQPPIPEWGAMTANARMYIFRAISGIAFPALFILLASLSFNLLGDSFRDVLDPKLRGGKAHE